MKKYLFFIPALVFYSGALAQINHSYTFAIGDTNGVNLTWDVYGDNLEILGCYLYKRVQYFQPDELISPELIVSDDSTFTFIDTGSFDPIYPPIYSIHIVTADSIYVTDEFYPFNLIEIVSLENNIFIFEVQSWNNQQCCRRANVFHDGVFFGTIPYNGSMLYYYDYNDPFTPHGDIWFSFEDNDWWLDYSWLKIYFSYIENLILTSSNLELRPVYQKLKVYPNPATTELWLEMPENMPFNQAQIELYSPTGSLLYRAQPTGQFHKIEVAYLPRGLYLVRVWDGEKWLVEKLVVR